MDARLRSDAPSSPFERADYWHHPASPEGGPAFKEWSHFCVMEDGLDVLVNFSHLGTRSGVEARPRLTVLVSYADGCWDGDMIETDLGQAGIAPGKFEARIGANRMWLEADRYRLSVDLPERKIAMDLTLTPRADPVVANSVRLSDHEAIRWMVVPHLRAAGVVRVGKWQCEIADAPAYHDRNWGCFSWGGTYAWEWATLVPVSPGVDWSLVFSRISDRSRGVTRSQSLILWRGAKPSRKFFGRDIRVETGGVLRQERTLKVPRVMSLLLSPGAVDVPERLLIAACGFGAEITADVTLDGFAQIGVPNDRGMGISTLCEIAGRARVQGRVAGTPLDFEARVQMEINSAAS